MYVNTDEYENIHNFMLKIFVCLLRLDLYAINIIISCAGHFHLHNQHCSFYHFSFLEYDRIFLALTFE